MIASLIERRFYGLSKIVSNTGYLRSYTDRYINYNVHITNAAYAM